MKAADILGLEEVTFIEPAFAALTDRRHTAALAVLEADEGRLLIDEDEEPTGVAFHAGGAWVAGAFLYRRPSVALIDLFESTCGEIFQEDRAVWAAAVREFFSDALATSTPPSMDDLNPVRCGILTRLITDVWGEGHGATCIDCCCGSGVGSSVLRGLGYSPLSYDNDEFLLSRGLAAKRLLPAETMWIDATVASRYMGAADRGIAIMAGEFNPFNEEMWQKILTELCSLSRDTLITVGTEREAGLVRDWGAVFKRDVDVWENPSDPLYDRWVCRILPKSG